MFFFSKIFRKLSKYYFFQRAKGQNVTFNGFPTIIGPVPQIKNNGLMVFGANARLRSFRLPINFSVFTDASLKFGDNVRLNDGVNVCASKLVVIGDNVRIGDMTYIYDTNFHEVDEYSGVKTEAVNIGNNVWIGAHARILAGANIGDHSVVAAGSIVTGTFPPKSLIAGVPAKVIKTLSMSDDWVRQ